MQFYYTHELTNLNSERCRENNNGWMKVPQFDEAVLSKLKEVYRASDIIRFYYRVEMMYDNTKAAVKLCMDYKIRDRKESVTVQLASIYLNTVEANCSAVHISVLRTHVTGFKFGTTLLREVLRWAKRAGYTFIHGNLAGDYQLKFAGPVFFNMGAKKMGKKYKNPRSGNINQWFYFNLRTMEFN